MISGYQSTTGTFSVLWNIIRSATTYWGQFKVFKCGRLPWDIPHQLSTVFFASPGILQLLLDSDSLRYLGHARPSYCGNHWCGGRDSIRIVYNDAQPKSRASVGTEQDPTRGSSDGAHPTWPKIFQHVMASYLSYHMGNLS